MITITAASFLPNLCEQSLGGFLATFPVRLGRPELFIRNEPK